MSPQLSADLLDLEPFNAGNLTARPFGLVGTKCGGCGYVTYPSRLFCPKCRQAGVDITQVMLSPAGRVHSFAVVRQAPEGTPVPYVLAQVDLEDGCRVLAQCVPAEGGQLNINDPVELVPAEFRSRSNEAVLGYKFRTVREESA